MDVRNTKWATKLVISAVKFVLPEARRGPLKAWGTGGAEAPRAMIPTAFQPPLVTSDYMAVDHIWVVIVVKWVTVSVQSLYMEGCTDDTVR